MDGSGAERERERERERNTPLIRCLHAAMVSPQYLLVGLCDTGDKYKILSLIHETVLDETVHCHLITKQQESIAYRFR